MVAGLYFQRDGVTDFLINQAGNVAVGDIGPDAHFEVSANGSNWWKHLPLKFR